MNKGKSLSPKFNLVKSNSRVLLQKLITSPSQKSSKFNDSVISLSSQDSKLEPSTSRMSQKIISMPFLISPTRKKVQVITKRFHQAKSNLSPRQNIGEHLLPLPADQVITIFNGLLTKYELSELLDYKEIYYLGLKAEKITPTVRMNNMGFDDDKTDYKLVLGDHIAYQYEVFEILGSGSFAKVCRCWDHKTKKEVAIKVIKSHKIFQEQGHIELKILAYLKKLEKSACPLFIQMYEYFTFRNHLCIVFELLSYTLFDLLKANNFKGFSSTLVRRFSFQIVTALAYLKKSSIIHCDLKPENIILVSPNVSNIKIIDFGSSCFKDEKIYSYIQSRIYRSPEVILGLSYSSAIDMWSFGCIIAEMLAGVPLFYGESELDQIYSIIEVLGPPPEQLLKSSVKQFKLFGQEGIQKSYTNTKNIIRIAGSKKIEEQISTNDALLLDFLKRNT